MLYQACLGRPGLPWLEELRTRSKEQGAKSKERYASCAMHCAPHPGDGRCLFVKDVRMPDGATRMHRRDKLNG